MAAVGAGADQRPGVPPADDVAPPDRAGTTASFGFPRDTFWPRSFLAFLVVGVVLTVSSA